MIYRTTIDQSFQGNGPHLTMRKTIDLPFPPAPGLEFLVIEGIITRAHRVIVGKAAGSAGVSTIFAFRVIAETSWDETATRDLTALREQLCNEGWFDLPAAPEPK